MIYHFLAALSIRLRKYANNWQNAEKRSKILRRMQRERNFLLQNAEKPLPGVPGSGFEKCKEGAVQCGQRS